MNAQVLVGPGIASPICQSTFCDINESVYNRSRIFKYAQSEKFLKNSIFFEFIIEKSKNLDNLTQWNRFQSILNQNLIAYFNFLNQPQHQINY
ncbi:hypothetical protein BpHYR1_006805 [Brachionus plicatilis]|uniref:Uncharacterized protein n=1 Tax=Brachionus plicatilis TaxID=10195 RepID=A0A3M7P6P3_BRAPC|nr:hypothetical protein BpHYR1_006805 [Brachionus plicatilis]